MAACDSAEEFVKVKKVRMYIKHRELQSTTRAYALCSSAVFDVQSFSTGFTKACKRAGTVEFLLWEEDGESS